ncbi:MAG: tetratricopeptide repeat protein [Comamonadaceae bacterium]|nr:MAG: tetratricopeptide repeat protein [Comamonadaceae bacterium]
MKKLHWGLAAVAVLALAGGGAWWWKHGGAAGTAPGLPAASGPAGSTAGAPLAIDEDLKALLALHRKIIVLLEGTGKDTTSAATLNQVGQQLFHDSVERRQKLEDTVNQALARRPDAALAAIDASLAYIEAAPDLFDADRLAFKEVLTSWRSLVGQSQTLVAIKLHKRIGEDIEALDSIERNYEKEVRAIFGRFEPRAIELKRERWDTYVAKLRTLYSRDAILRDYGIVLAAPAKTGDTAKGDELNGLELPPGTVLLTFDDGPHNSYTEEIQAILKKYGAQAVFFQVGKNLGSMDAAGKPVVLAGRAQIDKRLLADGHSLANHSFSHQKLSAQSGDALRAEIERADDLLKATSSDRSTLFRFPYGAASAEGRELIQARKLRSMMWNIDSLDWMDPVPASIAQRVMKSLAAEKRGIVLFHDIHERTVKALPLVLEAMVAEGYRFASWGKDGLVINKEVVTPAASATGYRDSWALVVGIDKYPKWPQLSYAVRDARAIETTLVERLGFGKDKVITLTDGEATRANILKALTQWTGKDKPQRDDRVFVFFAGHGATRKLPSGRDLGYLVPVDSDPQSLASDGIAMSDLQNIAEDLVAKHVFFAMDACYSGLGLTRGGQSPGDRFLKQNSRRVGRQMLTAGGADQMVADGGPGGHSVFTWTLLQGLNGKADLNGDGLITATELAAYVAPAVAGVSLQTPAFGSLPGSEGGDFVFPLAAQEEYLGTGSNQLSKEAVALNSRLDESRDKAAADNKAVVPDLNGTAKTIAIPAPSTAPSRQRAQLENDRGLQLFREAHYAEAEAAFAQALALKPDFALAANNLGFVYFKQDKLKEAARWYEAAIKMDPSRAVAWLNAGDAYARLGDKARGIQAYRTYLELAPKATLAPQVQEKLKALEG